MADNTLRIADIDAILRSGVASFTNDGTTITHNFAELRKERRRLAASDDTLKGKRPTSVQLDLGGF
jgi:hypothetical protein